PDWLRRAVLALRLRALRSRIDLRGAGRRRRTAHRLGADRAGSAVAAARLARRRSRWRPDRPWRVRAAAARGLHRGVLVVDRLDAELREIFFRRPALAVDPVLV